MEVKAHQTRQKEAETVQRTMASSADDGDVFIVCEETRTEEVDMRKRK